MSWTEMEMSVCTGSPWSRQQGLQKPSTWAGWAQEGHSSLSARCLSLLEALH